MSSRAELLNYNWADNKRQEWEYLQCLTSRKLERKFLFPATSLATFSGTMTDTPSFFASITTAYSFSLLFWKLKMVMIIIGNEQKWKYVE